MSQIYEQEFPADRAAALEARTDEAKPESWRPVDKGHPPRLTGVLIRYEDNFTTFNGETKPCRIAILRDGQGVLRSVWLIHQVLRNEFERVRPHPGELVSIRYGGKQLATATSSAYHAWTVAVDRDDADWGTPQFAETPAAEPAPPAAPPQPVAQPEVRFCERCGGKDPEHTPGCANDIPF